MNIKHILMFFLAVIFTFGFFASPVINQTSGDGLILPEETHLANMQQLTFGGENAECYFSFDGKQFIFQSTRKPFECDQIFTMNTDGTEQKLVSTGNGRTTCAYFLPGDKRIIYASTHASSVDCPPKPDFSKGYVWALFPSFESNYNCRRKRL